MNHNSDDDLNDQHLSNLYQQQATEQPSAGLDSKILALAHQKPPNRLWFNRLAPYSVAASAVLVSLLFLNYPENPEFELAQPDQESVPQPLGSAAQPYGAAAQPYKAAAPASLRSVPQAFEMSDSSNETSARIKSISPKRQLGSDKLLSQKNQLDHIDNLINNNNIDQAIVLLQQFKQQYPTFILSNKHQTLLNPH